MKKSLPRRRHEDKYTLSKIVLDKDQLEIDPDFQREEVWTRDMKQHLVDSVLRDFDIPKIYVREMEDGTLSVVDGQQRLKAIWDFRGDNFPVSEKYSDDFGGKKYTDLPRKKRDDFDNYNLTIITLRNYSDDDVRDMYGRLNKGKSLTPAERLNAFPGSVVPTMRDISDHPIFADVITLPKRRYRHYLTAARFIYLQKEGIADISPWYLYNFFEDNKSLDRKSSEARGVLRVLNYLKNTFDSATLELRREAWIITLYLLAKHLLDDYVMRGRESHLKNFFLDFYQKVQKSSGTGDEELIDFNLAVSRGTTSEKHIQLRQDTVFRRFLIDCGDLLPKDEKRLFTTEERIAVFRRDNGTCEKCGEKLEMTDFHVHHIVPHSKGGKTTLDNARLLCPKCHAREKSHF